MNSNNRITLLRPSQLFDSFMDGFFNSPSIASSRANDVSLNLYETKDNVILELKTPGFTKDDLDINFEGDMLTVTGTTKTEHKEENEEKKYYIEEITSQSFTRSVRMPRPVDVERAEASVENGMLKISIPKREESKARKIAISAK